ncbi:activin receptor type-1-like [Panonychus citri]|uniref:activin receptor type-1-like n=1 Tax=Panonychus citri TaxID=50023 RepID=UPI002307FBE8|nr:activin receptor type-1-like [Panonychus citri]
MQLLQCLACEESNCLKPNTKCVNAIACWEFVMSYSNGTTSTKKGCFKNEIHAKLQCNHNRTSDDSWFVTRCCYSDFCNDKIQTPLTFEEDTFKLDTREIFLIGAFVSLVLASVLIILSFYLLRRFKKTKSNSIDSEICKKEYKEDFQNYDVSETSGSGLGMPLLTSRTLSREINLIGRFYKGKSTEVWQGNWKGFAVAVKVFYTRDEHLFKRELEIYRSLNKHSNILEIFTSDCTSIDSCTQQWLVTTYYELGSLYDYLNRCTIGQNQCISILLGLINGLDYLHSEDIPPQIAHRDLKSKNILVKDDYNVCIADFGLAVTYFPDTKKIINGEKYKVGTIRYMAPEILSDTFDGSKFESHKKADIYSLSLVVWEVLRRCISRDGKVDDYSLPFGGIVPSDPTFEDMAKVVCLDEQRPMINDRMSSDPVIARISKIMEECWNTIPTKRLTSLRVKKSLIKVNTDFWK